MRSTVRYISLFILLVWFTVLFVLLRTRPPLKSMNAHDTMVYFKITDLHRQVIEGSNEQKSLFESLEAARIDLSNNNDSLVLSILVLACDRPNYLEQTLARIVKYSSEEYLPFGVQVDIVVSLDCVNVGVSDIIRKYGSRLRSIQQPDQSVIEIKEKNKKMVGYYKLARHYKWALSYIFTNHSAAVIVEDDIAVSPDFFEYMIAGLRLMKRDPTIWCISAWNDNGKTDRIASNSPELLYRTDFFPGLGWLMEKKVWQELEVKWPASYWDDWMRHPDQRKDRVCLRPEVPRTSTFGKIGTSSGQFFAKHLQYIKHYENFVPFSRRNLTYLVKETYDAQYIRSVYDSPLVSVKDLVIPSTTLPVSPSYRVEYGDREDYKRQAAQFGLMDDLKSGVPRNGYRGIVTFTHSRRVIHLAPPADWTGYDITWN